MAVELLATLAFVGLVAWPMARRSVDSLTGLMVTPAQTWAELPPHTQPAFEAEPQRDHGLPLQPAQAGAPVDACHPPICIPAERTVAFGPAVSRGILMLCKRHAGGLASHLKGMTV